MAEYTGSVGVSAVVVLRQEVFAYPVGTVGLVIGQACNGPDRYMVMIPGDPAPYSLAAKDLEVLQGVQLDLWWKS